MPVLFANLVYLSFDRTGSQAIGGGLYKRYPKKGTKEQKGNSKDTSESGVGVAELQASCVSVDAHGILSA